MAFLPLVVKLKLPFLFAQVDGIGLLRHGFIALSVMACRQLQQRPDIINILCFDEFGMRFGSRIPLSSLKAANGPCFRSQCHYMSAGMTEVVCVWL